MSRVCARARPTRRGLAWLLLAAVACASVAETHAETSPAAQVENSKQEEDLTTITLAPAAEDRLGIAIAVVDEARPMPRLHLLGGDLVAPGAVGHQGPLAPAERVRMAEALAAAEGELQRARIELEAATTELARSERLLRNKAGSVRGVEEARARLEGARASLAAIENRRRLLGGIFEDAGRTLWVRVPVNVAEHRTIAVDREARVGPLARGAERATRPGRHVKGPPSANPEAATVDFFYAIDNTDGAFQLGERVAVTVELLDQEAVLVVPRAAVLHDIHGGEWVYEETAAHRYTRRRVAVRGIVGESAILARGPVPGRRIVTAGAAELFGVEFGAGK